MKDRFTPCPHCGGNDVFRTDDVSAGGGHAPNLLPGLAKWYTSAHVHVVLCRSCGLIRLFAAQDALDKLRTDNRKWRPV
jgi:predicted nucleic-acid-binding Zn-ribbon protein